MKDTTITHLLEVCETGSSVDEKLKYTKHYDIKRRESTIARVNIHVPRGMYHNSATVEELDGFGKVEKTATISHPDIFYPNPNLAMLIYASFIDQERQS